MPDNPITQIPTTRNRIYQHLHVCVISDCDFQDEEHDDA